jgi:hypothetical protein
MSYQVDSYGNAYFPAGVSVASIPATTGTQNKVLVPGPGGRISSASISQLITQSGGNLVSSIFGRTGVITALRGDYNTDQVTEGQALYFSNSRARKAISVTTFNTSGPATYDSTTGIINIPQYGSGIVGNYVPVTRTITINGQTADLSANRIFTIDAMVYPSVGIPISNGTAWGTSIVDNSTNWNTAYSWGNHAGLYSLLGHTHTFASLTSIPTTLAGYGITDAATSAQGANADTAFGWGNHALAGYLTSFTETDPTVPSHVKAITTTNITNWNTAYSWGNHALAGYLTSFTETDPVWTSEKANYALKTYVDTSISNLIDAAPTTLDTLNELAAALGDDANFSTTVTNLIGTKEPAIIAGTTAQYWRGDKTWQTLPIYTISDLGGVPTSRTLTINGVSYDLTANRSWSALPVGGIAGQLLAKVDGTDYNAQWINEAPAASYTSQVKHQVKAAQAITKGQAVYVSSADGTNMIVSKASNATEGTSSKTMGLLESTVAINGTANVVTEGLLAGLDTTGANAAGDAVWLGTDGNLIYGLTNKPVAPAHLVFIGVVTRRNANNGEIFVKVQNGFEMNEIHDYLESGVQNNFVISYESSTDLYKPKSIATLLGYTPANAARNLTINGITYDLTADRSWTINPMVYPSAGIAVSTGSSWGTSITDNSTNWNTAYGWGNHASAGYLTTATAASTYLTQSAAATIYLTLSNASSTYLTQSGAASIYLTSSNASSTYLTQSGAASIYLTQTNASNTYASLSGAYSNPAFVASLAWSKITGAPAFLTGNQNITLSGDVTGSGTTSIVTTIANNAVTTAKINNGAVTAAKLATFGAGEGFFWAANTDGASIVFESTGDGASGSRALSNLLIALTDNGDEGLKVTTTGSELLYVNINQFQYKGNNVWHAGNLTNLNQLTNGPGYITSYTETDTLQSVVNRGSTTSITITSTINGTALVMSGAGSAQGIQMRADSSTIYPVFLRSLNPISGGETSAWIFKEADPSWGIWHNNPSNTLDITRAPGTGIENNVGGGTNTVMIRLSHLDGSGQFTGSILNRVGTSILDQNGNIPGTAASETLSTVAGRGSSTSSDLTFNGTLTMGTSGTQYIRMGRFPASISNAGEAWIGRASDRSTGTTTLQLGGSTNGSRFEVVDHAWSQVIFEAGMNVIAYKGNNIWHAGNFTPSSYLPLSGGTMTGDITMSGSGRGIYFTGGNNRIYFAGSRAIEGNGVNLQIGEGHSQTQIQSAITQIDGNLYIAKDGGRLYFDRPSGATVGGVGWHTNDVFYLGGHPDYGPGAGNHVRVYGFGSNLYLGNSTNGDVIGIDGTSGAVSIGRTTTLTAPLRFNESGYGRIAFTDNYHGMILRGIPNNAAGDVTATDVTSLIQHSGDFRFYRTNGSINELYFQVNATAPYWRGNTIYHTGNLTNLSQLTNGPGYITNNLSGVKTYGLGSLGANGEQTRRYEIARLGIDFNDWNSVGSFEVELHENYFGQGLKKVYNIWYGYVSNSGIRLVEQRGAGANNFRVVIGNEVVVSGDHRYLPVFVDVQYYGACNVIVRTNRNITENSNTAVGAAYIFTSPSGTNISSFGLDETVEFTTHGSASVPGNFQTTSGSSYLRASGITNGSYIELSGNLPGYSNGLYPVIKSGGTIHFANLNKYAAYLEGANTYFGIMDSALNTRIFLATSGNSYFTGGNLGIGIVNPSKALHVYTSANEGIFLQGTGGGVWMDMQVSGSNIHSIGAQVGGMGIYNRTSNLYRLFVTDAGNVSIGTPTSADVRLHVHTGTPSGATSLASNTAIAIDSNGNQYLEFRTRSDSAGIMQGILFTDNGRNAFIGFKEYTGAVANTYGESIHFAILDFSASDAGSGFWWGTSNNALNGVTSPLMFLRGNGNLNLGYGSDQGYKFAVNGAIYASGDITAFSDISVKKNVRTIDNALERVTKSRGVIYDRKDIESNNNIGFIAQELELEFPELISTNADGTKGVKYQNATAVLFEAVKEQQVQIEELKDLVKQLINR